MSVLYTNRYQTDSLSTPTPQKANHKLYLESLRILAILLVMFNHTNIDGFMLFTQKTSSPFYLIYIIISLACKIAVPLFFMISGTLLLGKNDTIQSVFTKRLPRIVLALLFSATCYIVLLPIPNMMIAKFFKTLYSTDLVGSLWYLYAYIAILLILPFLQKMVQQLSTVHFYYLIALHFIILGILPIVQYFIQPNLYLHRYLQIPIATPLTIFYFIIGYFIDRQKHLLGKKQLTLLGILAIISLLINAFVVMYHVKQVGISNLTTVERFHNTLFLFPTLFTFIAIKKLHLSIKLPTKLITYLGSLTFGIYLMERLLWSKTHVIFKLLQPLLPDILACFIWIFCAFLLGVIIVSLLKKVPFINKII